MEVCTGMEREVDKVVSTFSSFCDCMNKSLDDQIHNIESLRKDLAAVSENADLTPEQLAVIRQASQKVADCVNRVATDHRELHSTVSKVGKAVDKNFVADFDSTSRDDVFSGPTKEQLLNEVILQHFYRQGQLHVSETLAQESNVHEYQSQKEPFLELNRILEALKCRDLEPALEWAARNREALNMRGTTLLYSQLAGRAQVQQKSSLELRLNKLKFMGLLSEVMYAGAGLSESPYAHLLSPTHWAEIEDVFLRDGCALMGLAVESPLAVAVNAGCVALPALLNIKQVMLQRQVSGVWNAKCELPIEIDVGEDCRYHSVFACPILRQQVSDNNPPMRLTCGHCFSRDALTKLSAGHKVKCPYCQVEQNPADARQIFF